MEHLLYNLDVDEMFQEYEALKKANFQIDDWSQWDEKYEPISATEPAFPWLGFDHDEHSTAHFDEIEQYLEDHHVKIPSAGSAYVSPDGTLSSEAKSSAKVFQSWSYFGVLECFLGRSIHSSVVTRTRPDEQLTIYSRCIIPIAYGRVRDVMSLEDSERDQTLQNMWLLMELYMNKFINITKIYASLAPSELLQVMPAHAEMLRVLRHAIYPDRTDYVDVIEPFYDSALADRLTKRGWCPSMIVSMSERGRTDVLRYIDVSKMSDPLGGHDECTRYICEDCNIDTDDYEPLHFEDDCTCAFVVPPMEELKECLIAGSYPILRATTTSDQTALSVTAFHNQSEIEYVTISHVWSQGKGSISEKGLPICQVNYLQELADFVSQSKDTYFWIDSLCIPGDKQLRKKAIGQMKDVYAQAKTVLVIDDGIAAKPDKSSHWINQGIAIITSSWIQRMWTYQEGYLSTSLRFITYKFDFSFEDLLSNLRERRSIDRLAYSLFQELQDLGGTAHNPNLYDNYVHFHQKRGDAQQVNDSRIESQLSYIAKALSFRSTSKPDDEALAIGGILGARMDRLAELSGEARMRDLYLQLSDVPWNIIFLPGPKLTQAPFRWAPRTFMTRSTNGLALEGAMCTGVGLIIRLYVLVLHEPLSIYTSVDSMSSQQTEDDQGQKSECIIEDASIGFSFRLSCKETTHVSQLNDIPNDTLESQYRKVDFIVIWGTQQHEHPVQYFFRTAYRQVSAIGGVLLGEQFNAPSCTITLSETFLNPMSDQALTHAIYKDVCRAKGTWLQRTLLFT